MNTPEVGSELPLRTLTVSRLDVIRYCGASGDFNPLHWSDRRAQAVGLPGVIAHGMLTLAVVGRALTDWCGPAALRSYGARFSRPFAIPDDDEGRTLHIQGRVIAIEPSGDVTIELNVTADDGAELLTLAAATIAWPR
jgi:acyl dehydratase